MAQAAIAVAGSLLTGLLVALLFGLTAGVGVWAAQRQPAHALAGRLPAWAAGVAALLLTAGAGAAVDSLAPRAVPAVARLRHRIGVDPAARRGARRRPRAVDVRRRAVHAPLARADHRRLHPPALADAGCAGARVLRRRAGQRRGRDRRDRGGQRQRDCSPWWSSTRCCASITRACRRSWRRTSCCRRRRPRR